MIYFWSGLIVSWVIILAIGEAYAIKEGKMTLSRFVWNTTVKFPPLPACFGLVVGFLACHFWWGGHFSCFK